MKKHVCMIVYSNYSYDSRVRREAETIASLPEFTVSAFGLRELDSPRKYVLNGVNVEEINMDRYRGKSNVKYLLSYERFTLRAFLACTRLFFRSRIDIVHVHNMPNFLVFSALLPILMKKKIILDVHDTMVETYASKFKGFKNTLMEKLLGCEEKLCCTIADKIICVNDIQREAMLARGLRNEKITISVNVPDPMRVDYRGPIPTDNDKSDGFTIAYFGTVTKRLGIDIAIRVIADLRKTIPGIEFYIIGDGDDLQEFVSLSRSLSLDGIVHFSGRYLPYEELLIDLRKVDLGLIPNRRNAATELMLPVKLVDCIGLGIPVVVPRLRAIQYYFSDDMVFYFGPDNVESLRNAILEAYSDRERRRWKAANARQFFDKYGWEKHKDDLINLYRSFQ